jgi:hypothetical protein
MRSVGDPVAAGFVTSLAQPGGNITGVGGLVLELNAKLLELLKEAVPNVTQVAILLNPTNPSTASMVRDVESAARVLGVQLQVVGWRTLDSSSPPSTRQSRGALARCWYYRTFSTRGTKDTLRHSRSRAGYPQFSRKGHCRGGWPDGLWTKAFQPVATRRRAGG